MKTDEERITLIRNAVVESLDNPLTTFVARHMVARCPSRDEDCEVKTIYKRVKNGPIPLPLDDGSVIETPGVRFVEDPIFRDHYPAADVILRWHGQGAEGEDCDGHTILVDALLAALGYQTGSVIVSIDGKEYTHIFPVVGLPRSSPTHWLPLDTTVPEASPGWKPPARFGVKSMKVFANIFGKVHGRTLTERDWTW